MKLIFGLDLSVPPEVSLRREVVRWLRNREHASRLSCELAVGRSLRGIPEADPARMAWLAREAEAASAWAAELEGSAGTLRNPGKS